MYQKIVNGVKYTAVLVSHGYGAGWSTWSNATTYGQTENLAVHTELINYFIEGGYVDNYTKDCVGSRQIVIEGEELEDVCRDLDIVDEYDQPPYKVPLTLCWVKSGQLIRINEYDGAESIEVFDIKSFLSV